MTQLSYPLVISYIANWKNGPVEIVDLPMKNGGSSIVSCMFTIVYQMVIQLNPLGPPDPLRHCWPAGHQGHQAAGAPEPGSGRFPWLFHHQVGPVKVQQSSLVTCTKSH